MTTNDNDLMLAVSTSGMVTGRLIAGLKQVADYVEKNLETIPYRHAVALSAILRDTASDAEQLGRDYLGGE